MNAVELDVKTIRNDKIRQIARHYGRDSQTRQCIEEMAELTQAIIKFYRSLGIGQPTEKSKEQCFDNLVEEIADVWITLEEIKYLFSIEDRVNVIIKKKLDRQIDRIRMEKRKAN